MHQHPDWRGRVLAARRPRQLSRSDRIETGHKFEHTGTRYSVSSPAYHLSRQTMMTFPSPSRCQCLDSEQTSTTKHAVRRSTPLALARAYSTCPGASGTVTRTHCTAARSRASEPLAESPSQKGAATAGDVTRTPASGRSCCQWVTQSRARRPAAAGSHERRGRGGDCPDAQTGRF